MACVIGTYAAFGALLEREGTTENPYLYRGQQFDELTGLYSLRARYYAPGLGRFLSRDPYEGTLYSSRELNRYLYAANDPVNLADPSGRQFIDTAVLNAQSGIKAQKVIGVGLFVGVVFGLLVRLLRELPKLPDTTTWKPPWEPKIDEKGGEHRPNEDPFKGPVEWQQPQPRPQPPQPAPVPPRQPIPRPDPIMPPLPGPGPEPTPQPKQPTPTPKPTPTPTPQPQVIVELGAGDYSNAIAMKRANPNARVIATNLLQDWEAGKTFYEHGKSPESFPQVSFYKGWLRAKDVCIRENVCVEVGDMQAIENRQVFSHIAHLVYSILPYPRTAYEFGAEAARIARQESGTRVAVTSGISFSRDEFRAGFEAHFPLSTVFEIIPGSPYGEARGENWGETAPYTTYQFVVP